MSYLARSVGLAEVETASAAYVLNIPRIAEHQSPYVFEGAARAIWSLIDGTRTEGQVVDEIAGAAGVEREIVARDTRDFLATLRRLGLIQDVDG